MKVFYTKRGLDSYLFLMLLALVISFTPLIIKDFYTVRLTLLVASIAMIKRLWQLKTRYVIFEDGTLQINYLFLRKKIKLAEISKLEKGKFWFYTRYYASTNKGLLISVNNLTYLITPMREEVFMEEVLKINPAIQASIN